MSTHANPPFHLVDYSPWPLTGAIGAMTSVSGLVKWFHQYDISLFLLDNIITILTVYQWWRDVSREGYFQGLHTLPVWELLFILLEVVSFVLFFEYFFQSSQLI